MDKSERFWIRIEPERRQRLEAMAGADGVSAAEFVRRLIETEDTKRANAMRKLQRLGQEIESKD